MIDFLSSSNDNFIVMGNFNRQRTDSILKDFMGANSFMNFIKSNKCFNMKGPLINRKYYFKHSN